MKDETPTSHASLKGKGMILVVDDEEDVLIAAQLILEDIGFSVVGAEDGLSGLDLFRQHSDEIRAVLLDLTMPKMSGEELFEEMRRIRPDVPVILSSGYSEEEALRQFPGRQFNAFIHKPYQIDALIETFKHVLEDAQVDRV